MNDSTRRFFLLAATILSFGNQIINAQESRLDGRVVLDGSSDPVSGVIVSAASKIDGKVLAYGVTDGSGLFSIAIQSNMGELLITASSMMIETATVSVTLPSENIIVPVKEKRMDLQESRVQAPKISMHGDTLNYNVSSYSKANDRNIGEVLQRLPGIKVTSDGEIFYQNRQISKFYVEGLDLLQGKYGIATKNIDPAMVATVQVLENHQPIRVLEGSEIPQQAAINLKLKQSALGAFFLTAQAGLGFSPLLYSNELLGMRFTQKQQNLLLYKNDNTGRDIASEMTSFYGTASSPLLQIFSPEVLSPPDIDKKHYMFNNAHLISVNDLRLLKKSMTLISNVNFLTDRQKKNGFYSQTIYDPANGNLVVAEDLSSAFLRRELAGTITLEKNEKERYLTNRTDANIAWNQQECSIVSDSKLFLKAELPSIVIENKFAYKTSEQRWSSHILYSLQNNSLTTSPVMLPDLALIDSSASQQVRYSRLEADIQYYRSFRLSRRLSMDISIRPLLEQKHFSSRFLSGDERIPVISDSLTNDLVRTGLGTEIGGYINYRKRSLTAMMNVSGKYLYEVRDNHVSMQKTGNHLFLLSPGGYIEYKKRNFTYRVSMTYRQNVSDIRDDLTGYLMSSYRSFSRTDGNLSRSGRLNTDLGIHYKDMRSSFFCSFTSGYSLIHRNMLNNLSYDGILCRTTSMRYGNRSHIWWADMEFGKDIRPLSSTLKVNSRFSRSNSLTLYQDHIVNYSVDMLEINPSWYSLIGTLASLSYEADYRLGKSNVGGQGTNVMHNLRQSAEMSISPFSNASVRLACSHYYNSAIRPNPSRWFASMEFSYRHKRAEWMLDWSNIFNTKDLATYYYDDISNYCSRYQLRPMEIILRVKINIL